jgi:hypothetical protein
MTAPPVQLLTFAFGPDAVAVSSDFVDAEVLARDLSP